ncbi:MAG: peptide chain release factor N(5)-glutamine methyltransferase [Pseudomonadota bacterium]
MPSYQSLLDDGTATLHAISDTPRIDAEVLMQEVLQRPLAWLLAYAETYAAPEHIADFYALLKRRSEGEPIAYILGKKEFWSLELTVNHHVLIPRPETETLVDAVLDYIPATQAIKILELGTGSGAIALALAKERPHTQIIAVDVSEDALVVARHNADKFDLSNIEFIQSDWFTELANRSFDIIVSNPPYVAPGDPHLQQGDLIAEPDVALIGRGDGLGDIRHICELSRDHLSPQGLLMLEHGWDQATKIKDIMSQAGFEDIQSYRDLNDIERCTSGVLR